MTAKKLPTGRRISKKVFYALGGMSNPGLVRVTRSGKWAYYAI